MESNRESLYEKVWAETSQVIDLISEDEAKRQFLKSLLMGGTVAAEQAVINCKGLSRYWDNGDENKASGLTRLFFWMVFNYCHHLLQKGVDYMNSGLVSVDETAAEILFAFGKISEDDLKLYLGLRTQFYYDLNNSPHLVHFSSLLLAACCEICGHKCLDWAKVNFPIIEMSHLAQSKAMLDSEPIRYQEDVSEMKSALISGIKTANLYFEKN